MAQNIATLNVKFTADTNGLKQGAAQAGGTLKGLGNVIGQGASGLGGIFGRMAGSVQGLVGAFGMAGPAGVVAAAGFVAVGAGAYGAYKAIEQFNASADRIDKTSKLAERLDLTYGSLQKLSFIAGRSDVEVSALAKAMEHMGRTMGSGGMSMESRFAEQAKRIAAIKDPAMRAAEAFRVFGKTGGELIPLMKNFADDAARFDRFGGKFGFGIEDKDAKNVERMNDAWSDLVFIGSQLADKFVSKFGGPVATFLETGIVMLEDWATALSEMGYTWEDVGTVAVSAMGGMALAMQVLNSGLKIYVGLLEQSAANWDYISALRSGDKQGQLDAMARSARGAGLRQSGQQGLEDIRTGKMQTDFISRMLSGTDFTKRGGGFGSSGGGGSSGFAFAPGAIRDSQAAAKIINQSTSAMSPEQKAALDTARNTAATKAALDRLIQAIQSSGGILGLAGST